MTDIHRSSEALRESEARLRLALGSGGRGVWQLEPHTGKVIWDAQMHQLFGTDPASEVLSHDRFLELVHPDDRQRIEAEFAGMLKQPGHFEREFRIVQPDGRTRWIGSYGEVTCDAAGRPDCVLGVDFDITERKLAEEALARSEQELVRAVESHRAVAANMSEGLYSVDAQGLVTYINPAAERLFGWSSGELLGKKMHDITHYKHPDGSAFPAEECAGLQVLKRGTALIDFDDTFIRKDGTFFPVVYNVSPIRAKDGVVGLVVVFRDVTQEKEVRRTLEEGRARLAGIVHSAMDAIISVDEEQHIMQFNAAAEKMFGCPAASAIGQPLDRFIPARFRERHRRHVEEFGKTGVTTRSMGALNQISGRRANGEEFPIEASISQVETAGQKVFTAIVRDVADRVRAEAATLLRTQQQEAVSDLSRHALIGRDLDRLANDAVTLLAQILGVECVEMLELTRQGGQLLLRAGVGVVALSMSADAGNESLVSRLQSAARRNSFPFFSHIAAAPSGRLPIGGRRRAGVNAAKLRSWRYLNE